MGLVIAAAIWPRSPKPYYNYDYQEAFYPEMAVGALDPIDINEASLEEILKVPAVDEEIAKGIIDRRPIRKVDDLRDVRGIGNYNLSIIRQHIYIDDD